MCQIAGCNRTPRWARRALTSQGAAYGHLMILGPALHGWFDNPSQMPGALCEPLFLTDPGEARRWQLAAPANAPWPAHSLRRWKSTSARSTVGVNVFCPEAHRRGTRLMTQQMPRVKYVRPES